MEFVKYSGLGNDFIIIENLIENIHLTKNMIVNMCDRHFGIGADGILLICPSKIADIKMVIFNSDGSQADMCGNASRCFAKHIYEKSIIRKEIITVETESGIIIPRLIVNNGKVTSIIVNMRKPIFDPELIPCTIAGREIININISEYGINISALKMGVTHAVVFTDNIDDNYVIEMGHNLENHKDFPLKTNVNFVKAISRNEIVLRTWERGAGYTLACGTGACASVVAGIKNGILNEEVLVHLRGGDLKVSWHDGEDAYMEGPAEEIFQGVYFI